MKETQEKGTLGDAEPHPAARAALRYLNRVLSDPVKAAMLQEAFASCAIDGNRLAEVCGETLHRATSGQKVSDRYVLGLAWAVRDMEEAEQWGG